MTGRKNNQSYPIAIDPPQQNPNIADNTITNSLDALLTSINNFEGKPDLYINYFITQFSDLANAAKIPNELRLMLLSSKLAGFAKGMLINTPVFSIEMGYEELKKIALDKKSNSIIAFIRHRTSQDST